MTLTLIKEFIHPVFVFSTEDILLFIFILVLFMYTIAKIIKKLLQIM